MKKSTSFAPPPDAYMPNVVQGVSAAGSSQGTATAIPVGQDTTIVTTVAASTGVILPASGVSIGEIYSIANHGANALSIYPAGTGKIGTAAASAAYSLAAGNAVSLLFIGPGTNGSWCVGV